MSGAKNIVVCCDGTANEFKKDRTNVVKLFQTLVKDPAVQVCYYHPGVGTMAAPGFVTRLGARMAEIAGLAFGYGLSDDICDAYTFICRNFQAGDNLYLFGFSRGAYTARAIASLLRMYGLLWKDNDRLVLYAVRMMWAIRRLQRKSHPDSKPDPRISEYFRSAEEFKATFSRECKPHFVGVWDTVSSVGWFSHPLSLPYTANNPDIAIGRHAVALDERRAFFRTNLWRPNKDPDQAGPKDLQQVWFPGVHCDVGGGYAESESGLAKIPLKWMLDEARKAGLKLDEEKVALVLGGRGQGWVPPDPDGKMHNSMDGAWPLAEYVRKPRWDGQKTTWRANRFRRRTLPPGSWVDDSAWVRDKGQYQENLPGSAIRLSMAENEKDMAQASGRLNILLEKHHLLAHIDCGVIARIQTLMHAAAIKESATDVGIAQERELVIPAGAGAPRTLNVTPGRYRVQAFLPSGRILQTERVVGSDQSVDVRFRGEAAAREWLSWVQFAGVGPEPSALEEQPSRVRRGHDVPALEGLSGLVREIAPALRRPWRLDWTGMRYLAFRSFGMLVRPLEDIAVRLFGPSRERAELRALSWPAGGSQSWGREDYTGRLLTIFADTFPHFSAVMGTPERASSVRLTPTEQEGSVRLWDLSSQLQGDISWCRLFLMTAPDTSEAAVVPTYWADIKTQQPVRVEALVDESRTRAGARVSISIRDSALGGLLAYLGRGNWAAVRTLLVELYRQKLLTPDSVALNPLPACAMLYAAWVVSEPGEHQRWGPLFESLAETGKTRRGGPVGMPADAALLHALWRLSTEPPGSEVALNSLKSAYRSGIPCFSAGVFLLRDALARHCERDADARKMFDTVAKLASRVDPGQVFTVIRYPTT